jgi:hypothetical protein
MKISKALAIATLLTLSACAIAPNSVRPELEHMSHISQHFGAHPTDDAANLVNVVAHWDTPHHTYVEVAEGFNLSPPGSDGSFGEIYGPREQFSARVGYVFEIRK